MKTQTPWLIYGQPVNQDATATVHCPACGHPIQDDLAIQLSGEQRWPIQGSQLTCPGCKSVGSVSYSHWVELPNLATMWADIVGRLELPSTRMLLAQQTQLHHVDSCTATVAFSTEWLPMCQSRLPLLEVAVRSVLPNRKVVLRPTALQSAAAPQLQEAAAIPAVENEKEPEQPDLWEPGLRLVPEPIAPVVITEAPAPAAPELMFQDKPAPVAAPVAVEPDVAVFDRSEAPTSRCVDGEVQLTLASWKRLRPDLDAELGRTQAVHQTYVRLYGEQPTKAQGSSCYGAERLTECLRALSGVVVRLDEPQWRIREDSATAAA